MDFKDSYKRYLILYVVYVLYLFRFLLVKFSLRYCLYLKYYLLSVFSDCSDSHVLTFAVIRVMISSALA